jgi:ABC-type antimicrobial peptide transport system permease subunit
MRSRLAVTLPSELRPHPLAPDCALVLAEIGIYGVMAFMVGQRRREIGIRIALGAHPGSVVRLVVRQALLLAAAGVVAGALAALLATRLLQDCCSRFAPPPRLRIR